MRAPGFTIIVHRDGALDSRQYHIPRWAARSAAIAAASLTIGLAAVAVAYGPIVVAAGRTTSLTRQVQRLTEENRRVTELARALDEAEARYAHLRGMLGAGGDVPDTTRDDASSSPAAERLYVAPPMAARAPAAGDSSEFAGPSVPHRWPLAVAAYRTRGLAAESSGEERHPGIDLAVPVGSEVRAAGGGIARATGTDPAYGLYVLLRHPEGYETMYGHLSRVLVARGEVVRAGQAIALSGNSGRSTAPHLHFEVRRHGRSADPLSLVKEGT